MANFKIVISDPKSRKAFQKEIEQKASGFMGKKISEKVKGEPLGLAGYEFEVTGGSDAQGFPMRKDVEGIGRKKVLLSHGPGFHSDTKGQRKRKSVRGNTISVSISQINVKIIAYGGKALGELIGKTEKKKELTDEEKKKKLHEELSSKVDEKAPEKSRSDQILEEQARQEKTKKEASEKKPSDEQKAPEGNSKADGEKPAKPKKEEPTLTSAGKPSDEDTQKHPHGHKGAGTLQGAGKSSDEDKQDEKPREEKPAEEPKKESHREEKSGKDRKKESKG